MRTIQFSVPNEPSKNFMWGLTIRAEKLKDYNIITEVPTFNYRESKPMTGFYTIYFECPDCDFNTWFGFCEAIDHVRNNPKIYNCEEEYYKILV